jgi:zinc transporter 1/2/3
MSGSNKASHRALEENDPCYEVGVGEYDQSLHIAAIFIILVASAIGVALPLVPKYSKSLNSYPYFIIVGKCAGAGVMLACSLVHMILPSTEALTNECVGLLNSSYPAFSYVFALIAVFVSHLIECILETIIPVGTDKAQFKEVEGGDREPHANPNPDGVFSVETKNRELADDDAANQAKQISENLLAEFSLSVHSIFIGIGLAISTGSDFISLLIALIFHQLLEGVALGCRLADSMMGFWYDVVFAAIFSISGPVGIIIGICTYRTMDQSSDTFIIAQGTLDGISGGLLLYSGFLLLLNDFSADMKKHCSGEHRNAKRIGMFAALWIGAFGMSIIGAWA